MASSSDQLRTLPPELRLYVYSYLLFGDGEGDRTVRIGQKQISGDELPAILALREDKVYRRRRPHERWSGGVEEAFFQALYWTSRNHPDGRKKVNIGRLDTQTVPELIYELTGQERCRKAVSTHIQVLKRFLCQREHVFAQVVDTDQDSEAVDFAPAVSHGDPTTFTQTPDYSLKTALITKQTHSPHRIATSVKYLLPLSLVNHFYRAECLDHLLSNVRFDFGPDGEAFQLFSNTAPAGLLTKIEHVRTTFVEGHMLPLPRLPHLRTLAIDLYPRDPTRMDRKTDRAWGEQTEALLAGLGVTSAVWAKITLEMRWAADCERFEREYVAHGPWRRVVVDEEESVQDQEGVFRRRRYEMCGNGEMAGKVKEREKEYSIFEGAV